MRLPRSHESDDDICVASCSTQLIKSVSSNVNRSALGSRNFPRATSRDDAQKIIRIDQKMDFRKRPLTTELRPKNLEVRYCEEQSHVSGGESERAGGATKLSTLEQLTIKQHESSLDEPRWMNGRGPCQRTSTYQQQSGLPVSSEQSCQQHTNVRSVGFMMTMEVWKLGVVSSVNGPFRKLSPLHRRLSSARRNSDLCSRLKYDSQSDSGRPPQTAVTLIRPRRASVGSHAPKPDIITTLRVTSPLFE